MKLQVGVKLIIKNSRGRYLLIRRSEPLTDGSDWDIPGGRIEPREHLKEALTRELKEELGINFDGKLELLKVQDIFPPNADLHVVRITYATDLEKDIELGSEHTDFKWVSREESLSLNLDPYMREILEELS